MADTLLCLAIGNRSRGDDALGPLLLEWLEKEWLVQHPTTYRISFQEAFQLQPEHIYDLKDHETVLLLDADARFSKGIQFSEVLPAQQNNAFMSHGLSAEQLLSMYEELFEAPCPKTFLLSMGGNDMSLSESLSETGNHNLAAAKKKLGNLFRQTPEAWQADQLNWTGHFNALT